MKILVFFAVVLTFNVKCKANQNWAYWLWANKSEVDFKDNFEVELSDRCALKLKNRSSLTIFSKGGLPFLNNTIMLPVLENGQISYKTKPNASQEQ